jgi:hypothetical protein
MVDALSALQRHFEEQYGKLEIPGSRGKKQKRRHGVEERLEEEQVVNSDEEWMGIQEDPVDTGPSPQIFSFTDSTGIIEEEDPTLYKSFMVSLSISNSSRRNPRNQ